VVRKKIQDRTTTVQKARQAFCHSPVTGTARYRRPLPPSAWGMARLLL